MNLSYPAVFAGPSAKKSLISASIRILKTFSVPAAIGRKHWISETIVQSYLTLFRLGAAHSVETWHQGALAGGLYGVALGGAFFGESMFSRMPDASKAALGFLVNHLKNRGYLLLDTQYITPHLKSLGAKEISREQYMQRLERALQIQCSFVER